MNDGRAWVIGAILGGSVLAGVLRSTGSRSTVSLRFQAGRRPAVAVVGHRVAMAPTADEAIARVALIAYREAMARTNDPDDAWAYAWSTVEPLVDRHRFDLEDQGDLVVALLERAVRDTMAP